EGILPADRHVAVAAAVVAHRRGQAAGTLQVVIGPLKQLADAVSGEELRAYPALVQLPERRLGTVLAELEVVRILRLGPGAAHAHEAVGLVLAQQLAGRFRRGDVAIAAEARQ